MTFQEKNNYIVANASVDHFDKDAELYKAKFPNSPFVKDLINPFPLRKKELDERILLELFNAGVTVQEVEDNRTGSTQTTPAKTPGTDIAPADLDLLQRANIQELKYNDAKRLAYALKLSPITQSAADIKAVLIAEQNARFGQKKS
jgi:hypothetical protein